MSRRSTLWFAVLALVLTAPAAHAAKGVWMISGIGGAGFPMSDFGDAAGTGWQAGGAVDYGINDMFSLGADYIYNSNSHSDEGDPITFPGGVGVYDSDKFNTWQATARATYNFPGGARKMSPYALLGLGAYNTKETWEGTFTPTGGPPETDNGDFEFDTNFGGKLGLGARWKVNDSWGVGAETDYNYIMQDEDKVGVSSLQYWGLHAMVSFMIMPK